MKNTLVKISLFLLFTLISASVAPISYGAAAVTIKMTALNGTTPVPSISIKCSQYVTDTNSTPIIYGVAVTDASGLATIVISNPPSGNMVCYFPSTSPACYTSTDYLLFDLGNTITPGNTYTKTLRLIPNTTKPGCAPTTPTQVPTTSPTAVVTSTIIPTNKPVVTATSKPTSTAVITTTTPTEITQTPSDTPTVTATEIEETSNSNQDNSSNKNQDKSDNKNNITSIIGLVCGGILVLLLLILIILLVIVKRFREKAKSAAQSLKARFTSK